MSASRSRGLSSAVGTRWRGLVLALILPGAVFADMAAKIERTRPAPDRIACAMSFDASLDLCAAEIARAGRVVVVTVTFPNGFSRRLMFEDGRFLRGDATMSGVGTDTEWTLTDGVYIIRVDDQRFEVPEALVPVD